MPALCRADGKEVDAAVTAQASLEWTETDARTVDLIRVLAMDAVQQAGSGHPGTAMSLAPAAYLIFQRHLVKGLTLGMGK